MQVHCSAKLLHSGRKGKMVGNFCQNALDKMYFQKHQRSTGIWEMSVLCSVAEAAIMGITLH